MNQADTRFYFTGGNLDRDAPSYVERQADLELYAALAQGEFCYVLDSRQMGKSSLMVRTAARLREAGFRIAALDLTALGQNLSPEQWYLGLLLNLGRALNLEDELDAYWEAHERLSPLQRWMAALREVVLRSGVQVFRSSGLQADEVNGELASVSPEHLNTRTPEHPHRLVIFIDEIDAVRSLPFSTDEFFAAIRECYNRRTREPEFHRLTFCLLGVATPSDLIRDTRTTPFNIGRRIELTDFTPAEAAPLAQGFAGGASQGPAQPTLQRVLYWTGGHPYLTQRLCRAVAEADALHSNPKSKTQNPKLVDRLCTELFLSHRGREQDDNLVFVRERLLRALTPEGAPVDRAALLESYGRVRRGEKVPADATDPLVEILRLSGVARAFAGVLRVRNRIYAGVFDRAWVRQNMPDAELRRQRAAFRRGVLRTTAVATMIVSGMAALSVVAVTQARRAEKLRRAADRQQRLAQEGQRSLRRHVYALEMNAAEAAWDAGNLWRALAVLDAQRPRPGEEDLRGFEWLYLWRRCQRGDALATLQHGQGVGPVAFSPDGKTLAAANENLVRLWDTASRRPVASLPAHAVGLLAFSADGKRLVTGSYDRSDRAVKVWDLGSRQVQASLPLMDQELRQMALSPDGRFLAVGIDEGRVRLYDMAQKRVVATLQGDAFRIDAVGFSRDSRLLATAGLDTTVKLWNVASRREVAKLKGFSAQINGLAFSPDGRVLATATFDGLLSLWNVRTREHMGTFSGHKEMTGGISFSPDGKTLASNGESVWLWNVATLRAERPLRGHTSFVNSVAFSPDGKMLATSSDDKTVKLWNVAPTETSGVLRGHRGLIRDLSFSPDGRLLATGSYDATLRLWDVATERTIAELRGQAQPIACVAFSPDGSLLAAGSGVFADRINPYRLKLWSVARRRVIASTPPQKGAFFSVAFSPDGRLLASGNVGGTIKLWNAATLSEVACLEKRPAATSLLFGPPSVAFSPDARTLASCFGFDGKVSLWNVASRKRLKSLPGPPRIQHLAFSPDGNLLAMAGGSDSGDATITLWNQSTRQSAGSMTDMGGPAFSAAFSPNGRTLATGFQNATVKLWNLATRRQVASLKGHENYISGAAFSPDGAVLATGSSDHTARLWRAATFQEADPLHVIASAAHGRVRLEWEPLPHAVGYNVYRGPAAATRSQLTRLSPEPMTASSFIDQRPDLVDGQPQTYAVSAIYQEAAGKKAEAPAVMVQMTPAAMPPGFEGTSINEGTLGGSTLYDTTAGALTLRGSGEDIADSADGCYFLNRELTGDFQVTVTARTRPTPTHEWAKAGLMIRTSLEAGARNACLVVHRGSGALGLQWRQTNDGSGDGNTVVKDAALKLPITLRLTRRRNRITAYISRDGGHRFQQVGQPVDFEQPLPETLYVGLAITAHDTRKISEAKFGGLQIEKR